MDKGKQDTSILLFAYGNISRGDDALGPLLLQQIEQPNIKPATGYPLKCLQDYQIQVEQVMDMQGCNRVLLIDASQSLQQPFDFSPVKERPEPCYPPHDMTAPDLLHTYRRVYHQPPPPTWMLAIQGFSFELGQPLTARAGINLESARRFLVDLLASKDLQQWNRFNSTPDNSQA